MRKLATIRIIDNVIPIDGADAIELVRIGGWQCVTKKGEFSTGDMCVYFEIDSFLPIREEFEFLRKSSFKRMGQDEGFRIKTIKLRGQLSQGLALPLSILGERHEIFSIGSDCIGTDVTADLNVQKYEPPIPAELAGQVEGSFPGFIKKTDQERCQNIVDGIFTENENSRYEVTLKLDGTSFTGFTNNGVQGVCSRNWQLKINDANKDNTLIRVFRDSNLSDVLRKYGKNYAVQGELMGPGIQGNRENLNAHQLYVFDIYDIDAKCYLTPHRRHEVLHDLFDLGLNKDLVKHVPVIAMDMSLEDLGVFGIDGLLAFADGPSIFHLIREGLVFKRIDGGFSFKAISNQFLLKEND